MSDIVTLTAEVSELRRLNEHQSKLLTRIDLALTGDTERGIIGMVESQRAMAVRISTAENDIAELKREKWFARLGQSAVAGAVGAAAMWLKSRFFSN